MIKGNKIDILKQRMPISILFDQLAAKALAGQFPQRKKLDMSIPRKIELVELEEENGLLNVKVRHLEGKVHQLEMARMEDDELFSKPNSLLSASHKVVFRTIRNIVRSLKIDETIPTIIYMSELMRKTGLSDDQISKLTDDLDRWGFITKVSRRWKVGKDWKHEMKFSIGGQIKPLETQKNPKKPKANYGERNQGGLREKVQKCHNCGSENVEAIVYQCLNCGHHGPFDEA